MLKNCIPSLLTFFFFSYSYAQNDHARFEHITSEDGLSYSVVKCIQQDHTGLIWIGTNDGLNKYDGNKFTIYRNKPGDSTSISYNWIKTLYEDNSGQLWIGTEGGGLCRYNRDLDNFVRYVPDKKDTTSLSSGQVNAIYEFKDENQSTLWIATGGAVNRFIPEKNNFKRYYPEGKNRKYKANQNWVGSITQDRTNRLWIGTWNEGLFYYDAESDGFIGNQPEAENSNKLKNRNVLKLFSSREVGKNILWMGTYLNGLYKIDLESGKIKNFLSQSQKTADQVQSSVYDIYPDIGLSGSILWLGTYNGLFRLNTQIEHLTHFKYESGNPASLKSNNIDAVYIDKSGILWVGSDRGVSKLNPLRSNFINIGQNSTTKNNLINKVAYAVCETNIDNRDVLWIGTSEGLHKYDRMTDSFSFFEHDPQNISSLTSNSIHTILKSQHSEKEFLWIGTINGLNRIDPTLGTVKRYFIPDRDSPANWIWSLAEDETGQIWIGTQETSIYCFDPVNEKFTRYSGYRPVYSLLFDSFGNLWTGLQAGLRKINLKLNKSTWYWHNPNDKKSICHNEISAIFESRNKILWIGTSSGLNKYNRETETFTRYTVEDGLPSNLICAILEDEHENLWISTGKGISKFNPEKNSFKNFDAGDGLQGNEFKYFSAYKNKKGEMFFGGTNGLTMFHPDKIKNNISIPPIVLTDFQVYNKSIRPGINSFLKKNISKAREITLPYDQSIFLLEFAALDYHNPKKNQYAYKMDDVDPDWVFTNASRRFATYTNLDAGEYFFKVKGSNNDGLWNEEGTSVKVIILPPWWKTSWAFTFYVIFIGFVLFGLWRFQSNRLKIQQKMEMQNFEAEKLREVDKLKSHFFANISHEFRTPLTLIKGPVKQMMDSESRQKIKEQYKMILRNSDRLLGLINQILDLSKLESGEIKLKVQKTDFVKYLKGLVLSFSSLAERKKISLILDFTDNPIIGYADHEKLEKIVYNLLSNAFKFTPESGKITINVIPSKEGIQKDKYQQKSSIKIWIPDPRQKAGRQVRDDKSAVEGMPIQIPHPISNIQNQDFDGIEINVSNTGPGIPEDRLDKIFDRFYQVDDNYKKDSEGTGIGLALTKELVEIYRGEISVSSNPYESTTFTVNLPIAKDSFKPEEIVIAETDDSSLEKRIKEISDFDIESAKVEKTELKSQHKKSVPLLLIVEDNPDVTNYISNFMENDYRILTAENGKMGLMKTVDKYPDLVISDVMMPEMDGFELCQKIKSDERVSHIPIILLTAKADLNSKIEGLEFGADDYINKPFEADELKIRAKNLIEQRKKLREKFARLVDLQPNEITVTSTDEKFLKRLMMVFEEHISEPEFTTEQCAREVGMSRSGLNIKLKALTNQSTHEFIRTLRLKRAAQLLKKAVSSVAEVAYSVGFNSTSHFAKAFRQQFGQSPSSFAEKEK